MLEYPMRLRFVIFSALSATACYRYAPAEFRGLNPQERVVVELSDQGTLAVVPAIGNGVAFVEGQVLARDSAGVTLALSRVRRRAESASDWNGETLRLQTGDVRSVRTKEVSRTRTVFAFAGLTAAGAALVVSIARAVGAASSTGGGKGPPPPP
jgi:hypothetical protein